MEKIGWVTHWHAHPGVRSGVDQTVGERAADRMRGILGSWHTEKNTEDRKGLVNDNPQLTTEVKRNTDLLQEIRRQLNFLTPESEGPA